jgi:hypothetical protein
MRYRAAGESAWRAGYTENISRSGVLFRTSDAVPPRTPIEILLALPVEVGGSNDTVLCRGRVVRMEPPAAGEPQPAVAASITAHRPAHFQGNDPRRI